MSTRAVREPRTYNGLKSQIVISKMITFALPAVSRVRLEVYNTIGQRVEVLNDGIMDAGTHQVRWESHAPAGIYWCRMRAETTGSAHERFERTMKMVLIH